mmetsp:Transcript_78471/g.216909  ORF Transcript_78471/g.216909 Transcript_78471/m.216909 type:complete len:204 (+) Transcript_78471:46-657(+)
MPLQAPLSSPQMPELWRLWLVALSPAATPCWREPEQWWPWLARPCWLAPAPRLPVQVAGRRSELTPWPAAGRLAQHRQPLKGAAASAAAQPLPEVAVPCPWIGAGPGRQRPTARQQPRPRQARSSARLAEAHLGMPHVQDRLHCRPAISAAPAALACPRCCAPRPMDAAASATPRPRHLKLHGGRARPAPLPVASQPYPPGPP